MRSPRLPRSHRRTLRAQADVPHTFGTLLIPLALILMVGGSYQLERAIAQPLQSDAASILFGSVILACGLLLALYLLRAVRVSPPQPNERVAETESVVAPPTRPSTKPPIRETSPQRSFHTHYVDGARISR